MATAEGNKISTPEDNSKMKDLLIKLQILTNGLIEERKKSKNYLEKIKELEKILQQKDNEVVELTKQKFDLQASLTFEKSKQKTQTHKKKRIDETQINAYEEIINNQGSQLNELQRKLDNKEKDFIEQIARFKDLITIRTNELEKEKEKYKRECEEKTKLLTYRDEANERQKKFDEEKKQLDEKIKSQENTIMIIQKKNIDYQNEIDELKKERFLKDKEITDLKKKSDDMALRLNQMKMALVEKELKDKAFKVDMIKPKKGIVDMIFTRNKLSGAYEIIIKGKIKKDNDEEHINILDISNFLMDKNRVDIEYTVSRNIIY